MKVGIGHDNRKDFFSLGKKVAENAMRNGKITQPSIVISFCNGRIDHEEYFQGIQAVVGDKIPVIGGSSIGIITNDCISYEGYPAGAAIVESKTLRHREASVGDLDKNEKLAGRNLAKKLSNSQDGKLLLLFYDSIKHPPTETTPPVLNASRPLIEGIEER